VVPGSSRSLFDAKAQSGQKAQREFHVDLPIVAFTNLCAFALNTGRMASPADTAQVIFGMEFSASFACGWNARFL
jgi:hypothetical protein